MDIDRRTWNEAVKLAVLISIFAGLAAVVASAAGGVKVEVLEERADAAVPGYGRSACVELLGDDLDVSGHRVEAEL